MTTDALDDAFRAHAAGQTRFTRRMAITIGDHFGMSPMAVVRALERRELLQPGSVDWFHSNGGITRDHIEQARKERHAP